MRIDQKCHIWGGAADVVGVGDARIIDSPGAGGKYKITGTASAVLLGDSPPVGDDEKVKLTDWLIEQREAGEEVPVINEGVLRHIKTRLKKSMSERIKSLMLFLAKEYEVGESIDNITGDAKVMLMAYSSSLQKVEVHSCFDYCASMGYLEALSEISFCMAVEGKIFAEEIRKEDKQKRQCFVAMWFDENKKGMDDVYKKAIKPAIIDAGYKPYRVDKAPDLGNIVDQIIAQIRQSRFIIADFTAEKPKEPRGGVYYEAGFAYGLGLKVIPMCRKDFMEHIHFDTKQLRHIVWSEDDLQGFYEEIYDSIGANIGWSEDVKDKGTSFVGYKPKQ